MLLRTVALTQQFDRHLSIESVNLEIRQGDVYGLIGPHGAGKTTLLRLLALADEPTSGRSFWEAIRCAMGPLEALQEFPKMGRLGRVPGTRELVIPETAFILPYRIQPNHIEILAVIHSAQRWDDRFY